MSTFAQKLITLLFAFTIVTASVRGQVASQPLTSQQWQEDLRFMAEQMRLRHKSLFHTMADADFNTAVAKLDADIPELNQDQIFVRLLQIVAMVQDGHTGIFDLRINGEADDHLPVRFLRYSDGLYIRSAAPEYASAVGARVLKIGDTPWQRALDLCDTTAPHDAANNGEQLGWTERVVLNAPHLLHGLGIVISDASVTFTLEKNGRQSTITMKPSVRGQMFHGIHDGEGWIQARPSSVSTPLAQQHPEKNYWFQALPKNNALYFQFNAVQNEPGEPLSSFTKRLISALDQANVDRLIIDLRGNSGGDNTLLRPLLVALIRSRQNHPGGMFALIGPTTFSAAQNFSNRLDNYADVTFIGQPTAENVNFYGDPVRITLPQSHLEVYVSTLYWQDNDPRDKRTALFPLVAIEPAFHDFVTGADPALDYALTTPKIETIASALEAALSDGAGDVLARYTAFVADPIHKYLGDPESQLNALGYKLLPERTADAVLIFDLNVKTHQNSANAWDSLGEGLLKAGDRARGLEAYRRSLTLNPNNPNARDIVDHADRKR